MLSVQKLASDTEVLSAWSGLDSSQRRFLQKAFRNLFVDGISVDINLDDILKNKTLMFDNETGFNAECVHFSGTRNSQWCLTLGK